MAACTTVLATVPLVGCAGETGAAPPPLPPTRAALTSTPTATPSTVEAPVVEAPVTVAPAPAVTRPAPYEGGLNESDATTFAAYYLEVLNYTRQTNDSSELRRISDPSCEDCLGIADVTDQFAHFGMYYANPDIVFEQAFLEYYDEVSGEADVRLTMSGDLGVVNNADGTTQGSPFPFDHAEAMVLARFTSSGWRLVGLP